MTHAAKFRAEPRILGPIVAEARGIRAINARTMKGNSLSNYAAKTNKAAALNRQWNRCRGKLDGFCLASLRFRALITFTRDPAERENSTFPFRCDVTGWSPTDLPRGVSHSRLTSEFYERPGGSTHRSLTPNGTSKYFRLDPRTSIRPRNGHVSFPIKLCFLPLSLSVSPICSSIRRLSRNPRERIGIAYLAELFQAAALAGNVDRGR